MEEEMLFRLTWELYISEEAVCQSMCYLMMFKSLWIHFFLVAVVSLFW